MALTFPRIGFIFGQTEREALSAIPDADLRQRAFDYLLRDATEGAVGSNPVFLVNYRYQGLTGRTHHQIVALLGRLGERFPSTPFQSAPGLMMGEPQVGTIWRAGPDLVGFPRLACVLGPIEQRLFTQTIGHADRVIGSMAASVLAVAPNPPALGLVAVYDHSWGRYDVTGPLASLSERLGKDGFQHVVSDPMQTAALGSTRRTFVLHGFIRGAVVAALCLIVGSLLLAQNETA